MLTNIKGGGRILLIIFIVFETFAVCYIGIRTNYFRRYAEKFVWVEKTKVNQVWAVKCWTNTIKQLHLRTDVAFFGDSMTYFGDFDELFSDLSVCNLGFCEDTPNGMLGRMDMIRFAKPKKVFLMAGINGLKDSSLSDFRSSYTELVDSILSIGDLKLYVQSILPVNKSVYDLCADFEKVQMANKIIRDIAKQRNLIYIDLFSLYEENENLPMKYTFDGIHLKKESYQIWRDAITEYVYEQKTR